MKTPRIIPALLIIICLLTLTAPAQEKPAPAQSKYTPELYNQLVEKARKGEDVDYLAMRLSYTRTPQYNPYASQENKAMQDAYKAGKYQESFDSAQKILKTNFVDMDAHMVASLSATKLENEEKAKFHRKIVNGLASSITTVGDGRSIESAYIVINVREEYILLQFMGLERVNQELKQNQNQVFDVMKVKNPKDGQEGEIFFNVTIPFNWIAAHSGKDK